MVQHLAFVRKFESVAIVVTVMDVESLKDIPNEKFVVCNTNNNFLSGMLPSITLTPAVFEHDHGDSRTKGNSIDGILTSPHWFIRKIRTGFEEFYGEKVTG